VLQEQEQRQDVDVDADCLDWMQSTGDVDIVYVDASVDHVPAPANETHAPASSISVIWNEAERIWKNLRPEPNANDSVTYDID